MLVALLLCVMILDSLSLILFVQAEDGIRDLVRSRGLGDVYKRQGIRRIACQQVIWRSPGITDILCQRPDRTAIAYRLSLIHI